MGEQSQEEGLFFEHTRKSTAEGKTLLVDIFNSNEASKDLHAQSKKRTYHDIFSEATTIMIRKGSVLSRQLLHEKTQSIEQIFKADLGLLEIHFGRKTRSINHQKEMALLGIQSEFMSGREVSADDIVEVLESHALNLIKHEQQRKIALNELKFERDQKLIEVNTVFIEGQALVQPVIS